MTARNARSRRGIAALAAIAAAALIQTAGPPPAAAAGGDSHAATAPSETPPLLCERAIEAAETARRLPRYLVHAIALVESGHMSATHGRRVAWPWTVMAEGKGRYYADKKTAIAAVERLRARGVRNIDVGCMQVNLHYHGDAFDSLAQAFDPVHNVAYATAFLLDLRHRENSWTRAIKHYHSRTRAHHMPYRDRVFEEWRTLKQAARRGGASLAALAVAAESGNSDRAAAEKETADARSPRSQTAGYGHIAGSAWPPRNYAAQQRLQLQARSRVMNGGFGD